MEKRFLVSKLNIILILVYILEFSNFEVAYFPMYQNLRYLMIAIIGLYIANKLPSYFRPGLVGINSLLILFSMGTLLVSLINRDITERDPLLAAIVFVAIQIETFFVLEHTAKLGRMFDAIDLYYRMTLCLTIITDVFILFFPSVSALYGNYLVGTKFGVAYLHVLLITFTLVRDKLLIRRNRRNLVKVLFLAIVSFLISMKINCNTGIMAIVMITVICILPERAIRWLRKPWIFIGTLGCSFLFSIAYDMIMSISALQNFIVNVLGRDLTLTGRVFIYERIPFVMQGRYLIGYGYGTSYEICRKYIGYADAQNGLLEWILQVGVPTTIVLVLVFYFVFRFIYKNGFSQTVYLPIIAALYVFTVLATIEITISPLYFGLVAILFAVGYEQWVYEENEVRVKEN